MNASDGGPLDYMRTALVTGTSAAVEFLGQKLGGDTKSHVSKIRGRSSAASQRQLRAGRNNSNRSSANWGGKAKEASAALKLTRNGKAFWDPVGKKLIDVGGAKLKTEITKLDD